MAAQSRTRTGNYDVVVMCESQARTGSAEAWPEIRLPRYGKPVELNLVFWGAQSGAC